MTRDMTDAERQAVRRCQAEVASELAAMRDVIADSGSDEDVSSIEAIARRHERGLGALTALLAR